MIISKLPVLCKHKKSNKKNVRDVINTTENLLSNCYVQVQVNLLPPFPSMLIITGAQQTLCFQSY